MAKFKTRSVKWLTSSLREACQDGFQIIAPYRNNIGLALGIIGLSLSCIPNEPRPVASPLAVLHFDIEDRSDRITVHPTSPFHDSIDILHNSNTDWEHVSVSSQRKPIDDREANPHVMKALLSASEKTGFPAPLLMSFAWFESKMDIHAQNTVSSAKGLFQFTNQSWLEAMKKWGPDIGYKHLSETLTTTHSGHYVTQNYKNMHALLSLRDDPFIASYMAARFLMDCKETMERELGHPVKDRDIYIAHVLGAEGAVSFLQNVEKSPNTLVGYRFPTATKNNHNLFYDGDKMRTIRESHDAITTMISEQTQHYALLLNQGEKSFMQEIFRAEQKAVQHNHRI